jgi:C-terminal processing protease CtpA/Prc
MLVLIDELAGSCGDAFPMLIKSNRIAKLFGKRTMGLGGNVEPFTLQNSRTTVALTRGLFTSHKESEAYTDQDWIENNGVVPDISYEHTVEDTRKGFVEYVKTFSNEAINQIKE